MGIRSLVQVRNFIRNPNVQTKKNISGSHHTVDGSSMLKGSRHILQESSGESSKAAEDDGAEMGGVSERGGGVEEEDEEKEVKSAMGS